MVGNVVREPLLSAYVGYWVRRRGSAAAASSRRAVALAVDHCFGPVGLHRLEATVRPENAPSLRVLAKLGFREEGLFRRYLDVDGAWRDHLCFAITAEEPPPGGLRRLVSAGRAAGPERVTRSDHHSHEHTRTSRPDCTPVNVGGRGASLPGAPRPAVYREQRESGAGGGRPPSYVRSAGGGGGRAQLTDLHRTGGDLAADPRSRRRPAPQEVARPSGASLAGRVLARPRRRRNRRRIARLLTEEGDVWTLTIWTRTTRRRARRDGAALGLTVRAGRRRARDRRTDRRRRRARTPVVDDADDEPGVRWERPPPRYRPGRGGFDPRGRGEAARARYAVPPARGALPAGVRAARERAAAAAFPVVWWAHGAIDLALVVYLIYLRRQVRMEDSDPRAAAPPGWPAPGEHRGRRPRSGRRWARRGREVTRRPPRPRPTTPTRTEGDRADPDEREEVDGWADEDDGTTRVRGVGEPVGLLPPGDAKSTRDRGARERPAPAAARPAAPVPPGTSLVVVDDDELDLHDLGTLTRAHHRRAVGE